ncbi:isoprenylcysteine carboxylmethyltransferase family protein [Patescibacteria group bacterium]|nr:isoprenylcysteine carboxylmethyltransferase family protein [Patescibacteria group bacterium]
MGIFLLILQLFLFLLLFLFSNFLNVFTFLHLLFFLVTGIVFVGLGAVSIGRRSYSPLPTPRKSNVLSQRGIYRYVRHPMYAGLLFAGLAFWLSRPTLLTSSIYLLFFVISNLKAGLEEKLMAEKHPKYEKYKQRSKRYLPFFY